MVQITKIEGDASVLADPVFYRAYYEDMQEKSDDEVQIHWIKHGLPEGRFPNDEKAYQFYLSLPEVPKDFDADNYLKYNPDVAENCTWKFEAISHYLEFGNAENRPYTKPKAPPKPSPARREVKIKNHYKEIFDAEFYRIAYPDLKKSTDEKCLEHWMNHGRKEDRAPNLATYTEQHKNYRLIPDSFSLASYVLKNKDLYKNFKSPIKYILHFLNSGIEEGRDGNPITYSPQFINDFYGADVEKDKDPVEIFKALRDFLKAEISTPIFLTANEFAASYGIFSTEFIDIFDHEAYKYSNVDFNDIPSDNYAKCLEHFLTIGLERNLNISYTHYFDSTFYIKQYKKSLPRPLSSYDPEALSEDEKGKLFIHWVQDGIAHEMHPNLTIWALEEHDIKIPSRLTRDIEHYQKLNTDLKDLKTPGEYFTHITKHGSEEDRPGIIYNSETAEFYSHVASNLLKSGKRNEAVNIYNRILNNVPAFHDAAHNLGDDLLRHGFHKDAAKHYSDLIDSNSAQQWSYINLSLCHEQMSNHYEAAKTIVKGALAFPDDVNMRERAEKASRHHFMEILRKSRIKALVHGIPESRDRVREALTLFDKEQFPALRDKAIKHVSIIGNHDLPQCRAYRIDQKVEHLEAAGYDVRVYKHTENLDAFRLRIDETDAVIFYRVAAMPDIIEAINAANIRGLPTFYEIDDLLFDEALFPPPLETYAGQIGPEQHASMATDVPLLRHAMGLCRYGIASTPALAAEMEPVVHSGKVFLHRNAFGSLHEKMSGLPQDLKVETETDEITIFYGSGTKAHKDDFHNLIEPVFVDLHSKYGARVKFIVIGHITMTPELESLGSQLELLNPIWDTEDYWTVLRERADINLSVLSRTRVTDSKSEIKWLEAAMFGIPSVVSNTATHEDVIHHGTTGFLCETSQDFYNALEELISKPEKRKQVGEAAHAIVQEKYSINAQSENIKNILQNFSPSPSEKRKKRIAVVNVFYPPQAIGGATRVVYDNVSDIINEFGDQFHIEVFTTKNGKKPYEVEHHVHDGIRVTAVTTIHAEDLEQRVSDAQMAIAFKRFLSDFKPDLVHFHCIQRLTESIVTETRKAEIPYIITAHDGWWISDQQFLVDEYDKIQTYNYSDTGPDTPNTPLRKRAFRKDLFGAENIVAVSDAFAQIYRSAGLPNVIAIENGVSSLPTIDRIPSANGRVRLAQIGGMSRHKGFHLVRHALEVSPEFNNLELLMVDHAAPKGSIKYEQWGSTPVTFIPKVPQNEIASLFAQIDVLLAPSIWPESYGLVTREALMCGCRVIASDRGGIGQCVDHGENGLVINVENADALRDALAEVDANHDYYLSPPEQRPKLRLAVQQARDLTKLYRKIIEA